MGQSSPIPKSFCKQRNITTLLTLKLQEMCAIHHYRLIAMRIRAIHLVSACDTVPDVGVAPGPGLNIKSKSLEAFYPVEKSTSEPTQTKCVPSLTLRTVENNCIFPATNQSVVRITHEQFSRRSLFRLQGDEDCSNPTNLSNKSI